jgi:hypothetical protein
MAISIKDALGASKSLASKLILAATPLHQAIASLDEAETPTYRAGGTGLAMVATPTVAIQIKGSATKTVRVKRIALTGVATAAGNMSVAIQKASDAGTVGSADLTGVTATPLDSDDDAATAVVSTVGTANYTTIPAVVGSQVGSGRLCLSADGTGVFVAPLVFDFEKHAVVLRGVLEHLCVNFLGDAIPSGGIVDWSIEWVEDES